MNFLCNLLIFLTLFVVVKSANDIIINELDIDGQWIELKNKDPVNSYNLGTNQISLQVYSLPNNAGREAQVGVTGVIAPNGVIKFDLTSSRKRKKRSAGGSIVLPITTTGSKMIFLYKNNFGGLDTLVFMVDANADQTHFSSWAPEWDNNYLLYESGKIFARKGENKNTPSDWEIVTVGTPDAQNDATGDPHFMQTVVDENSNKPLKICYDVTGKSGDEIYILGDKFTKTKVTGILMNDYYMHSIKIYQQYGFYTIHTNEIQLKNHDKMPWKNSFHYQDDNNSLEMFINDEQIFILIRNTRYHKLSMTIKRSNNPLIGKYLDVSFGDLSSTNARYNGLIGYIGKQSIAFVNSPQNDQFGVLKVNNETNFVELQKRNNIECWLVKYESVITPKQPKYFILN